MGCTTPPDDRPWLRLAVRLAAPLVRLRARAADARARQMAALDGVNFGVDYRNREPSYPGLQVDHVRVATVSAVPEGGTRGLMLVGALTLAAGLRRRAPGTHSRRAGADVSLPVAGRTGLGRA